MNRFLKSIYHWLNAQREWLYLTRVVLKTKRGVTEKKRKLPIVVSLTSYGSRIKSIHLCLESLLSQSLKPDRIILWLAEDETLTNKYFRNLEERGLELRRCEDIKSFKKIIFTLHNFPDSIIVTADDDCYYPRKWLEGLYNAWLTDPKHIYCYRAHRMTMKTTGKEVSVNPYSQWDFKSPGFLGPSAFLVPTGVGGVLYPPNSLDIEVLNKKAFMELCPNADDIWLKAMSLKKGVLCQKVKANSPRFYTLRNSQDNALYKSNWLESENDEQISNVFNKYGLYRELTQSD